MASQQFPGFNLQNLWIYLILWQKWSKVVDGIQCADQKMFKQYYLSLGWSMVHVLRTTDPQPVHPPPPPLEASASCVAFSLCPITISTKRMLIHQLPALTDSRTRGKTVRWVPSVCFPTVFFKWKDIWEGIRTLRKFEINVLTSQKNWYSK